MASRIALCVLSGVAAAWATCDESLSGDGSGYRGCQTLTRSGKTCQNWASQSPHVHPHSASLRKKGSSDHNFCRNPDGAATIWCYTATSTPWESTMGTAMEYCDPRTTASRLEPRSVGTSMPAAFRFLDTSRLHGTSMPAAFRFYPGASCGPGYKPITRNWQDCESAALSLGYARGGAVSCLDYSSNQPEGCFMSGPSGRFHPEGCFMSGQSGRFHFNNNSGGDYTNGDAILCQDEASIGMARVAFSVPTSTTDAVVTAVIATTITSTTTDTAILMSSDGTQPRPHCSWTSSCTWDHATKSACAVGLCQAAGYPLGGTYVSASNNMCNSSFSNSSGESVHYYAVDEIDGMWHVTEYTTQSMARGTQISAACTASVPAASTATDDSNSALWIPVVIAVGSVLFLVVIAVGSVLLVAAISKNWRESPPTRDECPLQQHSKLDAVGVL